MRMSMRRFTRLTNAFSKKIENLEAAVALHFMYYNFARIHQTLRVTPGDGSRGFRSRLGGRGNRRPTRPTVKLTHYPRPCDLPSLRAIMPFP